MKRVTLYSSSRPSITGRATSTNPPTQFQSRDQPRDSSSGQGSTSVPRSRWRSFYARHEQRLLWLAVGGLITILLVFTYAAMTPPREITQEDIRAAVLHTLETNTLP